MNKIILIATFCCLINTTIFSQVNDLIPDSVDKILIKDTSRISKTARVDNYDEYMKTQKSIDEIKRIARESDRESFYEFHKEKYDKVEVYLPFQQRNFAFTYFSDADAIIKNGEREEFIKYGKFLISLVFITFMFVTFYKVKKNKSNIFFKLFGISNNNQISAVYNTVSLGTMRIHLILSLLISFSILYYTIGMSNYSAGIYYLPIIGSLLNISIPLSYAIVTFLVFWTLIYIYNWVKKGYISKDH